MRRTGPFAVARPAVLPVLLALLLTGLVSTGSGTGVQAQAAGGLPTAIGDDGTVHFTAAGDYGAGPNSRAVLATIASQAPDLNLALGDLSYGAPGTERSWCDLVTGAVGAGFPFQLLAGNHESNGLNGSIDAFAACLPNRLPGLVGTYGRQWYVDVPQVDPIVRFIMVSPGLTFPDGTYGYGAGSPRYEWTSAAIDGARSRAIPWVVVGTHTPCLSTGRYPCDMGADLQNLLLAKRVDLVLNGHEHLYQRSHGLAHGAACPAVVPGSYDADCVVDRDDAMTKGAGTVLATVGTGGVEFRDVVTTDPEARYFARSAGLSTNGTWGVLDVRLTRTSLSARFVRAAGGTFADAFTVTAPTTPSEPPPPAPPEPPPGTVAKDAFGRTVTGGFGAAEVGGAWRTTGSAAHYAVAGGVGRATVPTAGSAADAALPGVSSASTDLVVSVSPDKRPGGGGLYAAVGVRRIGGVGEYRAKVHLRADGTVGLALGRTAGGAETALAPSFAVAGLTYAAGDRLLVRAQATGSSPTTIRARVWKAGTAEPASWGASRTDSTAGLQRTGSVGVNLYLSGSATNAPVRISLDDLVARRP